MVGRTLAKKLLTLLFMLDISGVGLPKPLTCTINLRAFVFKLYFFIFMIGLLGMLIAVEGRCWNRQFCRSVLVTSLVKRPPCNDYAIDKSTLLLLNTFAL